MAFGRERRNAFGKGIGRRSFAVQRADVRRRWRRRTEQHTGCQRSADCGNDDGLPFQSAAPSGFGALSLPERMQRFELPGGGAGTQCRPGEVLPRRARSQRPGKRVTDTGGSEPKLDHGCDSVPGPCLRCIFRVAWFDGDRPPPVAPPPEGIVAGGHGRRHSRRPCRHPLPQALAARAPAHGQCPGRTAQGREGPRVASGPLTQGPASDGGARRRGPFAVRRRGTGVKRPHPEGSGPLWFPCRGCWTG